MDAPFIDIHTHRKHEDNLFVYSYMAGSGEELPAFPYSTGIHPWKLDGAKEESLNNSISPLTVAIGETGLDFAIDTPRPVQEKWFRFQLARAQELKLPVIIHCVKAYNELMTIVKEYRVTPVIHGFTGSPQLTEQLLKAGFYLSYGENITRSPKTREALAVTPLNRLFLETDTSDADIREIYYKAAEIKRVDINILQEAIHKNYQKVFLDDGKQLA